jgi:uncharacterized protein with HEPN domain
MRAFLEDILVSARLATLYAGDLSVDDLLRNTEKQDAIIHRIEIIGEAAGHISGELRSKINLPWPRIVAMRNLLAHQYWGIDLQLVWSVVHNDLPAMIAAIEPHLEK